MSDAPSLRIANPLPPVTHGSVGTSPTTPFRRCVSCGPRMVTWLRSRKTAIASTLSSARTTTTSAQRYEAVPLAVLCSPRASEIGPSPRDEWPAHDERRAASRTPPYSDEPFQKKAIQAYHDNVAGMTQEMINSWTPVRPKISPTR